MEAHGVGEIKEIGWVRLKERTEELWRGGERWGVGVSWRILAYQKRRKSVGLGDDCVQ